VGGLEFSKEGGGKDQRQLSARKGARSTEEAERGRVRLPWKPSPLQEKVSGRLRIGIRARRENVTSAKETNQREKDIRLRRKKHLRRWTGRFARGFSCATGRPEALSIVRKKACYGGKGGMRLLVPERGGEEDR